MKLDISEYIYTVKARSFVWPRLAGGAAGRKSATEASTGQNKGRTSVSRSLAVHPYSRFSINVTSRDRKNQFPLTGIPFTEKSKTATNLCAHALLRAFHGTLSTGR